jgi:hypothetical protein
MVGGGGNPKGIHSNKVRHLQPKQVPQECLIDFRLLLECQPRASAWPQAETTRFSVIPTLLPALTTIGYRLRGPQASDRPESGPPPITREGLYK